MTKKLTIGMAHYDDFDGVYFTIQALQLYHNSPDIEFLVVDNKPIIKKEEGRERNVIKDFITSSVSNGRYIKYDDTHGTSAPRDLVFREAAGKAVMCVDCHVLLVPNAINRLLEWYDHNPNNKDLLTGPLISDDTHNFHTHFDLVWNDGMWGTWGGAWSCKCGQHFTVQDNKSKAAYHDLLSFDLLGDNCTCGSPFPHINYAGCSKRLLDAGFKILARDGDDPPFEIPAQGLGLFSCNKDAWLGFNKNFNGFGGEEGYIHIKYRQAGHRCLLLPFLGWMHRFDRVNGVKYPCIYYDRIRNYVVGHQELNLSIDDIYQEFCESSIDENGKKGHGISQKDWDYLITDPIGHKYTQPVVGQTLEQIYNQTKSQPRDMEKHMDHFRDIASRCNRITAMVKRKEWDVVLLSGKPKVLTIYTTEPDQVHQVLKQTVRDVNYRSIVSDSLDIIDIDGTDMLVLHTVHNASRLYAELSRFANRVHHYILIRSTGAFGNIGEDGGAGMFDAIKRYINKNSKWFVIEHSNEQWGYTLLSCIQNERDKKMSPSFGLWN
jgi:hypothetical protein